MMKKQRRLNWILVVLSWLFTGCTSQESLIRREYDSLLFSDSSLIYEEAFSSSGATGNCASYVIERWYGTEITSESLIEEYIDQLSGQEWVMLPEDARQVWRKENDEGRFTLALDVFTHNDPPDPHRGNYSLPDSALLTMANYQTVSNVTLSHMFPSDAEQCFSR